MAITLYSTLTKSTDELTPLRAGTVSLYSCGPTVYDHVHIGNLSAFIVADILRRTITGHGLAATHVMNFTDVDDKTIRRSRETYPDLEAKEALGKLTTTYGDLFLDDMELVGNDTAALTFIKAADPATIDAMQRLVTELYDNGFAYIAEDGVYFSIDAYKASGKTYGQLVELTESSTASERIRNDEYDKDSVHDFALWKTKKPGEPAWEFTLGGTDLTGRPGWHIECSAMSRLTLGQPFDIHTGGIDLAFPHHENEIAQSTAGKDDPTYASMFVHNEHILVDGKKMAKSAGNFYTLRDLIEKDVDPLAFRLLVLQSHYRRQTNFSLEGAVAAHNRLKHWRSIAALRWQGSNEPNPEIDTALVQLKDDLLAALGGDLNTPEALRLIDEAFTRIENTAPSNIPANSLNDILTTIDNLLGLRLVAATPDIDDEAKRLIAERESARQAKDWSASDRLRDELIERGITLRDTASGSVWGYA